MERRAIVEEQAMAQVAEIEAILRSLGCQVGDRVPAGNNRYTLPPGSFLVLTPGTTGQVGVELYDIRRQKDRIDCIALPMKTVLRALEGEDSALVPTLNRAEWAFDLLKNATGGRPG